jgi:crotonobetainyl-CoA:carnitine CoA-transferase CaiB-like acyl-CoA transferase
VSNKPPFDGVRVLDLCTTIAGPWAAGILADQGADVIKVEEPTRGDGLRHSGTTKDGISCVFHMANRGKRSIALDLKRPEGVETLKHLIKTADVFMHNTRPGVMERLGLGYDAVRAVRADIIYASISGFGERGPMAQRPAYDPVIQCYAGMAWLQGEERGKPELLRNLVCDKVTALMAAQAISAALYARKDGRGGQHVRLSMLAAAAAFTWLEMSVHEAFLDPDARFGPSPADACHLYRFADGWANVVPNSDQAFLSMCGAFGVQVDDPRLHTFIGRVQNPELMARVMAAWEMQTVQVPLKDGIARLEALDIPCAPVLTLTELANHPHVEETGIFMETDYPGLGRVREVRPPAEFSQTPSRVRDRAPALGHDTDSLLRELGLDVAALRAAKVVR